MEFGRIQKVLVVGEAEVGKSSLIIRYITNTFDTSFGYCATIGVEFMMHKVGSRVLQIWDVAGQQRFASITSSYLRGADLVLLLYSVAERESFLRVSEWLDIAKNYASENVVMVLVGTKTDMPRQVSTEDGKNFAKHHGIPFVETSAFLDINVARPFEVLLQHEKQATLFERLLESGSSLPWMRSKLMVVGQGKAGKTATVRSLLNEDFDPEWKSTVGAELTQTHMASGNGEFLKMDGDDEYATMMAAKAVLIKEAEQIVKSEQVLNQHSEEVHVPYQLTYHDEQNIHKHSPVGLSDVELQYLMEKGDVARRITLSLFLNAEEHVDDLALTVWDYGGQEVFYTLHHLFLTRFGLYLLAFDMRDFVASTVDTTYLEFWLGSIALHAPQAPVMLVGTYADAVTTEKEYTEINQVLKRVVDEKKVDQVEPEPDFGLLFRPISNLSGNGVNSLRKGLDSTIRKQDYVHKEVPLKWMRTLDMMLDRKGSYLELSEVTKIYESFHTESPSSAEVDSMLFLFNELGVVVYITATTRLREIVTTRPQWLLDSLSKVIRDEMHRFDKDKVEEAQIQDEIAVLFDSAVASRDLLEFLWDRDQVDFLIEFMKNCLLLSPWPYTQDGDAYLVPSLLKSTSIGFKHFELKFVVKFKDTIPQGVFQRMVCICVSESRSKHQEIDKPRLTKEQASFAFESSRAIAVQMNPSREIVCSISSREDAGFLIVFVQMILNEINNTLFHGSLSFDFYFKEKNELLDLRNAKKKGLSPWFSASKEGGSAPQKVYNIEEFFH